MALNVRMTTAATTQPTMYFHLGEDHTHTASAPTPPAPTTLPTAPSTGSSDAATGAAAVGFGATDMSAMLTQLTSVLDALRAAVQALVSSMTGGGSLPVTAGGGAMAAVTAAAADGGGGHAHNVVQQGGGGMAGMEHGSLPTPPAKHDPRFLDGSVGPTVKKGKAQKLTIPDGPGFHGAKGRKQNNDDKKKNNYSVTDANFSNQLGLLPKDPDTGKPMTYVQHIQTYAAANYLETYAHPLYEKLIANQNAGKGTILGSAAYLMGLVKTPDPALEGLTQSDIASIPAKIPGTPMDARAYVASGKDITGQNWARMHHAGSQFKVLSGLIAAGVDWKNAMVLSGDDAVSGSGRLNGVNGQNGKASGMNKGEREVFALGAQIQAQTGINVIQLMMGGHNHLGLDPSALTKPNINDDIGYAHDARDASTERANAIEQLFLNGKYGDAALAASKGTKADNRALLRAAGVA